MSKISHMSARILRKAFRDSLPEFFEDNKNKEQPMSEYPKVVWEGEVELHFCHDRHENICGCYDAVVRARVADNGLAGPCDRFWVELMGTEFCAETGSLWRPIDDDRHSLSVMKHAIAAVLDEKEKDNG